MSSPESAGEEPTGSSGPLGRFFAELRRRKVVATAGVYLFGSFVAMQVVDDVVPYVPFVTDPQQAGRVVFIVLLVCFPIAMLLAWVLEFTPPQLRRELTLEEAEEKTRREEAVRRDLRADTVGVLPFENLSDDPDDAYFSDGVTDDVMMSLSQIRGLRVLPRTTVRQYKGVSRDIGDIAAELGAATLVTGSVRRSGARIRVNVVALDARTEDHLWSERFDRELEDIFKVQSEIASSVGGAVARELSPEARTRIEERGTTDGDAYDLYLRARFSWNQRTEASLSESLDYFQRALEHDPEFALAHAGTADAFIILGVYGLRAPREALEAARASAGRALELDPSLGEAMATLGCVRGILDWDWAEGESTFRRAIELAPSYPTARQWYAMNILAPQRRFEEARAQLSEAIQLDPGSSAIATSAGIVALDEGEVERAADEFEAVIGVHPRFSLAHQFLGQAQLARGEPDAAVASLRRAAELSAESSETLAALAHALARVGQGEEAEGVLGRLLERSKSRYVSQALIAQVLIGLERPDDALDHLETARDERASDLVWLAARAAYDPIRETPRFRALLEAVGVA